MQDWSWRTWAGLAMALAGTFMLFYGIGLGSPPGEIVSPVPADTYTFKLNFLGRRLIQFPVGSNTVYAAATFQRIFLPLLFLLIGAFMAFIDTPAGKHLADRLRSSWEKRE
jgi:hypothetical protein